MLMQDLEKGGREGGREEQVNRKGEQLSKVREYALEVEECRRRVLLKHFGEGGRERGRGWTRERCCDYCVDGGKKVKECLKTLMEGGGRGGGRKGGGGRRRYASDDEEEGGAGGRQGTKRGGMFEDDGFQDRKEEEEEEEGEEEEGKGGREGGTSQGGGVDPEVEAVLAEGRSSTVFKKQVKAARTAAAAGNLWTADQARAILRAHVQEEERQQGGQGGGGGGGGGSVRPAADVSVVRKKAPPPVLTTGKGKQIKHIISTNSSVSSFSSSSSSAATAAATAAAAPQQGSASKKSKNNDKKGEELEALARLARFEAVDEEDEERAEKLGVGQLRRRKVIREIFTLSTEGLGEGGKMLERVLESIKEEEGAWWMTSKTKEQYQQYARERMAGLYD